MGKIEELNQNIRVNIANKENCISVDGHFSHFLSPYGEREELLSEEYLNQFTTLSKEELDTLVNESKSTMDGQVDAIESIVRAYAGNLLKQKFAESELRIIEHIEKVNAYFNEKEQTFNQVVRKTDENQPFNVKVTNGIYSLHIFANKSKYQKNYDIYGYLTMNDTFNTSAYKSVDTFQNKSYSDAEKVENYINNKLKKFSYLFLVKKAILAKHIKQFNIHPRVIKDLEIQVFDEPADIVKYAEQQAEV